MDTILKTADFATHLATFENTLLASGRSKATTTGYSTDVRLFLKFLQNNRLTSEDLSPQTLTSYCQHLLHIRGSKENSIRRKVIGIRQFFVYLGKRKIISANPFARTIIPDRDDALSDVLQSAESARVLVFLRRIGDYRTRAIIHLLAYEGIKATELITLEWRDLTLSKFAALLQIRGRRERVISLQPKTARALHTHRQISKPQGMMFKGFKGPEGAIALPALTRHGLKFLLHRLAVRTSISSLSPERLRHHAIAHLLVYGKTPDEVRVHLGLKRMGNIQKHCNQLLQ